MNDELMEKCLRLLDEVEFDNQDKVIEWNVNLDKDDKYIYGVLESGRTFAKNLNLEEDRDAK